ncbi:hypothetical protein [Azonexus hydrophilus]
MTNNSELEICSRTQCAKTLVELSDTPRSNQAQEAANACCAESSRISARILLAKQRDFDIFEDVEMRDNLKTDGASRKPERAPPADFIKWAKSDGFISMECADPE